MITSNKKLRRIICLAILILIIICGVGYNRFIKAHTYTLSGDGIEKSEQIQPVAGSVKVNGTQDTDVVFIDVETGETYQIGYITPGAGDRLKLEKGKWYRVEGAGELTIYPINVQTEAGRKNYETCRSTYGAR